MNGTMIPDQAREYGRGVVDKEMPEGLKKYIKLELFPRVHYKVKKQISYSACRKIMQEEGFKFTEHKKAVYYNGHEQPDVVED